MAFVGDYAGQWVGEWLGQALNPGAMYANLSGNGGIASDISSIAAAQSTGGWEDYTFLNRPEKKRLEEVEEQKQEIRSEISEVRQQRPQSQSDADYQQRIYLALLAEQLAALEAEEALLLAKLRALDIGLASATQRAEEDIAFCMMLLAS